jgi:hypothetical protein
VDPNPNKKNLIRYTAFQMIKLSSQRNPYKRDARQVIKKLKNEKFLQINFIASNMHIGTGIMQK